MSLTTQLLMDLIDGYVETRYTSGHHTYNEKTALARKLVHGAVEVIVKKASAPLFDVSKGIPTGVGLVALPVVDPSLLPTKESA